MGDTSQDQTEQLIEQLIQKINRWDLTVPAILFLHVTRPFSFIASQGLLLCQPVLGFFSDKPQITSLADLLADRNSLDLLAARLEENERLASKGRKE